jgi:hypothetical protein
MVTFLAVYRGPSLPRAELVAVTTEPGLVAHVASALLREGPPEGRDRALGALRGGRRRALRAIRGEAVAGRAEPVPTP